MWRTCCSRARLFANGNSRFAPRSAPGGCVVRQLLTESLAIAAIGGAAGVLTAVWASRLLRAALPAELIGAADIRVDLHVLAFAVTAIVLAAVLAGVFPAVGATRTKLHGALMERRAAGTLRARRRALGALVVAEFALALVLAIGAGLMIRTFANLSTENPGFNGECPGARR